MYLRYITMMQFAEHLHQSSQQTGVSPRVWIAVVVVMVLVFGVIWWRQDAIASQRAEVAFARAQDSISMGDTQGSLKYLDQAIRLKPDYTYHLAKFMILSADEKYHEATYEMERALALKPNDAYLNAKYAALLWMDRLDDQKAIRIMKNAVNHEPLNSDYQYSYGQMLQMTGQHKQAIRVLEALIEKDPHYSNTWSQLSLTYDDIDKPEQAVKVHLRAVEMFPDSAFHWFQLGQVYDDHQQTSEAVRAYKQSIRLAPDLGAYAVERIHTLTGERMAHVYQGVGIQTIPSSTYNGRTYIKATLAGERGTFLMDTGANVSEVYQHFIDRHDLVVDEYAPRVAMETASDVVSVPVLYADMSIGKYELGDTRVAVMKDASGKETFDGIIGMNVLSQFDIEMAHSSGQLTFHRKTG